MPIARPLVFTLLVMVMTLGPLMANDKYFGSRAARAEFDKGKVPSQSGDWKAAIAAYKKAIQLDPNFADAHQEYMFARVRLAVGDLSGLGSQSKAERKKISERVKRDGDHSTKTWLACIPICRSIFGPFRSNKRNRTRRLRKNIALKPYG